MVVGLAGGILSEIILIVAIFLILYVIFALGKTILGLILNIILGFIAIFILNSVFGLGISFDLIVIVITAILGLPGVAIVVLLKLIGISLAIIPKIALLL